MTIGFSTSARQLWFLTLHPTLLAFTSARLQDDLLQSLSACHLQFDINQAAAARLVAHFVMLGSLGWDRAFSAPGVTYRLILQMWWSHMVQSRHYTDQHTSGFHARWLNFCCTNSCSLGRGGNLWQSHKFTVLFKYFFNSHKSAACACINKVSQR